MIPPYGLWPNCPDCAGTGGDRRFRLGLDEGDSLGCKTCSGMGVVPPGLRDMILEARELARAERERAWAERRKGTSDGRPENTGA